MTVSILSCSVEKVLSILNKDYFNHVRIFQAYIQSFHEVLRRTDIENVYNIITDKLPSESYREIFNQTNIRRALHVGNRVYHMDFTKKSDGRLREYLDHDFYLSVKPWLEELVEHYGVMCYT